MRLWAKQLIPLLPDDQLRGQYRELNAIASNLASEGTPNHILVNKILEYPVDHFYTYAVLIREEMLRRRFQIKRIPWDTFICKLKIFCGHDNFTLIDYSMLYDNWMNKEYLIQCICNLHEKYSCGGIELKEWFVIVNGVRNLNVFTQEEFDVVFT